MWTVSGLSKFAWLARSVARNRSVLVPPAAPAVSTVTGNVGGNTDMTSAPPTSDARNDDASSQTINVRHIFNFIDQ